MSTVTDIPIRITEAPVVDEAVARRALRAQIARLEAELTELVCCERPDGRAADRAHTIGPRMLTFGALERVRDELAHEVARVKGDLDERGRAQEDCRRVREEMLLEPERHRWVRVSNEDIGERGCTVWQVRPSFSLLGRLMGWWRVRISSGCPLAA